jgi:CubicO group peptidase (beta-lactamase class C family)
MKDNHASIIARRAALGRLAGCIGAPALGSLNVDSFVSRPSDQEALPGDAASQISTYLSRLEMFGFAGAVLVARDEAILVESTQGLADRAANVAWRADTVFDTGSVTKQFTAAAVLALEADGKLAVSDSIANHIADVPAGKAAITIHHLLTHTSGLGIELGGDYEPVSRDELVRRVLESGLASAPGERHAYSNAGYSLLAAIVEITSNTSFDRFVRERLFLPAAMTSSGYHLYQTEPHRLARGYRDGEDAGLLERAVATGGQMWNLIGNGGLLSTITDLHRWMSALQNDTVLPAPSRSKLFHPHALVTANYAASGTGLHYGYRWYVWKQPSGKTVIWHLGGNNVTNTAIRRHVDDHTVILYASNVSEFHDPRYPVPAVERLLAGSTVQMPPQVVPLSEKQLARCTGTYRGTADRVLTVTAKQGFPQHGFLEVTGEGQEAFTFAVDGDWLSDAAYDVLNARTAEVVEASRVRSFDVVARFFGPRATAEEVEVHETAFWNKRHLALGEYVRTRVLGTMRPSSRRYSGRTVVAIDFSRGTTWREYFWTPEGHVGDVGRLDRAPASRFFPVSETCFATFEPAHAKSGQFCIESIEGSSAIRIAGAPGLLRLEPPPDASRHGSR